MKTHKLFLSVENNEIKLIEKKSERGKEYPYDDIHSVTIYTESKEVNVNFFHNDKSKKFTFNELHIDVPFSGCSIQDFALEYIKVYRYWKYKTEKHGSYNFPYINLYQKIDIKMENNFIVS